MVIVDMLAAFNFLITFALASPGAFLPKAVKLSQNVTLLKLEANSIINESIWNPIGGFSTSFKRSFYERKFGVERPRLNETNIDPDLYGLLAEPEEIDGEQSMSRVIKDWQWWD